MYTKTEAPVEQVRQDVLVDARAHAMTEPELSNLDAIIDSIGPGSGLLDKLRMSGWLWVSIVIAIVAFFFVQFLPAQTQLAKLLNVTLGAYVGYLVDRNAFKFARITPESPALLHVRRAIIIGACVVAMGLGS